MTALAFRLKATLVGLAADETGNLSVVELVPGTLITQISDPDEQGLVQAVANGKCVRFFARDLKSRTGQSRFRIFKRHLKEPVSAGAVSAPNSGVVHHTRSGSLAPLTPIKASSGI